MRRLLGGLKASLGRLSSEDAAIVLALGVVFGTLPIYGLGTILCALASIAFGVNLPALQLSNQLATPLQLAMLVPFVKVGSLLAGSRLRGAGHSLPLGWNLGAFALQAVVGWLVLCLPLGLLAHFLFTSLLRSQSARQLFQRQAAVEAR